MKNRYQLPAVEDIKTYLSNRKYSGTNSDHKRLLEFTASLNHKLNSPDNVEPLLGAAALVRLHVRSEYSHLNPDGTLFTSGSELAKTFAMPIPMGENNLYLDKLPDTQRVVCLQKLDELFTEYPNDFIEEKEILNQISKTYDKNWTGERWQMLIDSHLRPIVMRLKPNIEETIGLPNSTCLEDSIEEIYKIKVEDSSHASYCDLIEFINKTCSFYSFPQSKELDSDAIKQLSQSYQTRIAAVLFMMKKIEEEPQYYYTRRSPENARAYVRCQRAINVKGTAKINDSDLDHYFKFLSLHLANFEYFKRSKEKYHLSENTIKSVEKILPSIKKSLKQYFKLLLDAPEAPKPTDMPSRVGDNIKSATQYTFDTAVSKVTGSFVPAAGKQIISGAMGVAGYLILGPGGAIIGKYLGDLVGPSILSTVMSTVVSPIMKPIGSALGSVTGGVFGGVLSVVFYVTDKGIRLVLQSDSIPQEELRHHEAFFNALLKCRPTVIEPEVREAIRKTWGEHA